MEDGLESFSSKKYIYNIYIWFVMFSYDITRARTRARTEELQEEKRKNEVERGMTDSPRLTLRAVEREVFRTPLNLPPETVEKVHLKRIEEHHTADVVLRVTTRSQDQQYI